MNILNRIHSRITRTSFKKRINGHSFLLPFFSQESSYFRSEQWISRLLLHHYKEGTTFIDVGANIGTTMLNFKSLFPDGYYLGFEPNPTCASYFQKVVSINKLSRVELMPVALSDQQGVHKLHFIEPDHHSGTATIVDNFRNGREIVRSINVPFTNTLPAIDNSVSVIKIDVEGSELNVIRALLPTIKQFRPSIICEVLPTGDPPDESRMERQQGIEEILNEINYSIFKLPTGDYQETIGITTDWSKSDYLFLPNKKP